MGLLPERRLTSSMAPRVHDWRTVKGRKQADLIGVPPESQRKHMGGVHYKESDQPTEEISKE